MDESPDIAGIEADLERERATLTRTLDDLQARLSPDSLVQEAKTLMRSRLGPATAAVDQAVRANPLAAACIGVGLAWLAFGRRASAPKRDPLAGTRFEAMARWEDEGGPPAPLPEADSCEWIAQTDRLRNRATAALARIAAAARDSLTTPEETAHDRATVVATFATDARKAIRHGLDALPTASQDAVAAVREQAYLAHRAVVQGTGRMVEDAPLTTASVAMILGAGLATLFPRSAIENRLFGAERDRLVASAASLLEQERARAGEVMADFAGTMRHEVRATASDLAHMTS